jgi:CHAT domain-containing protein/tetratricopeptide (TPR) repeat protein
VSAELDELSTRANAMVTEAASAGDPALLDAAIGLHEATLVDQGPFRPVRLSNLSVAHRARFTLTGNLADAERAVEFGEHAVAALGAGDPNAVLVVSNACAAYVTRYGSSERPPDLDRVVRLGEWAVAVLTPGDPHRATLLTNLGTGYWTRFTLTGDLADVERAIRLGELAVAALAPGDPNRAAILSNLAASYWARFGRSGQLSDVDRAIEVGEQAVTLLEPDDPHRAGVMTNLGTAHNERFERTGDMADLDRAIGCHQQAAAVAPGDPTVLSNLSTAFRTRFERLGEVADLDRAIEHQSRAVAAGRDDHPMRALFLTNLGIVHQQRFERLGDMGDLDRALDCKERAVAATPAGHPDLALRSSNLGVTCLARFHRLGRSSDVDSAVRWQERAVAATPPGHPMAAHYHANLGSALHVRFEHTGSLADLADSIVHKERSVAETPDGQPIRATRLSNLALAYQSRFERLGAVADMDRAVEAGGHAVALTPADHADRALHLGNLGTTYHTRFEHLGSMSDLDLAIECHEQALAAAPADHADLARYLSNVGVALHSRFRRVKSSVDRMVEVAERAVTATPPDHPDRVLRLSNLARTYQARGEHTGEVADLDRAVDAGRQALAAATGPARARYLTVLAHTYQGRWRLTRDATDLDSAIEYFRQALAETPADHPLRAARLFSLGYAYQSSDGVTSAEIAALAEQAVAATTGPPDERVRACWVFGRIAHRLGDPHTARRALDEAVALLPSTAARETSRTDQEYRLGTSVGLVGEAIAAHCALSDPAGAVEVGERGRGILLSAQLDLRAGLDVDDPELARRYRFVLDRLNAPDPSTGDIVSWRKRLWAEYDAVVAEVRAQGGPVAGVPAPVVADRTVVLVNASRRRGDAIVLTAGRPVHVPLPDLHLADAERYAVRLREATHDSSAITGKLRRQRVLTELLGWLWDSVVGPVLDTVEEPRVWWLPTGVLGQLPLHAAGHPGQPGALDRVVSSYAPTMRALARSGDREAVARRQLVVALARTPGLADLPFTAAEAAGLPADLPPLVDERATVAAVRAALPVASWAHFACHASTNPDAPSEGGLHLHDGVLPIAEVSRLDLPDAELAYLSACSTGHAGRRHADESIHLASAFQLAGFRHVIASLWPLDDGVAATAADHFYRRVGSVGAAYALHEVVSELRTEHADRPHLWAPLIHSGS